MYLSILKRKVVGKKILARRFVLKMHNYIEKEPPPWGGLRIIYFNLIDEIPGDLRI